MLFKARGPVIMFHRVYDVAW